MIQLGLTPDLVKYHSLGGSRRVTVMKLHEKTNTTKQENREDGEVH